MQDYGRGNAADQRLAETMRCHRAFTVAASLALAAIGAVTVVAGYPGFQDFGEGIYQARILSDLLSGDHSAHTRIAPYPAPLALPQLLLAACVAVTGPVAGGVAFLILYGLTGAWAIQQLVRRYQLACGPAALLLTGLVLLGSGFWNGFIGTQWGLVLLMVYLSLERRVAVSWQAVLGFGLVSFFTHGLTFAIWGLAALSIAVAERRLARFLAALAPSAALVVWYLVSSREASRADWSSGGLTEWVFYKGYTVSKLGSYRNLVVRSSSDHDVAPALYWMGVASNALVAVVLGAAFCWLIVRGWNYSWAAHAPLVVAAAGMLLVVLATPGFLAGIVNPGERVLSAAMVLVVVLLTGPQSPRRTIHLAGGLTVVGLVLTAISVGLIPAKAALGGPLSEAPASWAGRSTSLYTHRVDQFEEKVLAAERGDLTLPLAWHTSMLVAK